MQLFPLRPSETSISGRATSAAAGWIFELRLHNASAVPRRPPCLPKHEIGVSGPRHRIPPYRGTLAGAARQTRKDRCRSRRSQRPGTSFADFSLRPEVGFTLSPSGTRSNPWRCAIRVEAARQTGGKPERSQGGMSRFLIGHAAAVL